MWHGPESRSLALLTYDTQRPLALATRDTQRPLSSRPTSRDLANPGEVLAWEAGAMTRYAHYRFEVRELLDNFRKTGVGYGPAR